MSGSHGVDSYTGGKVMQPFESAEVREGLLQEKESYAIRGAIFEVHREMGSGFLEAVYRECLAREFQVREIPFLQEKELSLLYKGAPLRQTYRADFICFDVIIVEVKCVRTLQAEHRAQVLNYLRISGLRLGLLANFGSFPKATVERLVL